MKTLLISVVAAAVAGQASAADIPVKASPAPVITTWTGWFIGVNAGHSWGQTKVGYAQDPGILEGFGVNGIEGLALNRTLHPRHAMGGVQAGYNFQTSSWLIGVVADINFREARDRVVVGPLNTFGDTLTLETSQSWLGTVRARAGLTFANSWLIYATGGFAYGRASHSVTQTITNSAPQTFSASGTNPGWVAGAGTEYRLDRRWSIGAEYLYVDLGTDTLTRAPNAAPIGGNAPGAFPATRVSFKDVSHIARVTFSYRFD